MRGFAPVMAGLALWTALPGAAFAAAEPVQGALVMAPTPVVAWPTLTDAALDVAIPTLSSGAMLALLGGLGGEGFAQYGMVAGAIAVPPAALAGFRDRPFALDSYAAATSGGVVGLLLGLGVSLVLFRSQPSVALAPGAQAVAVADPTLPLRFALMAVGQGLGTASGYLAYQHAKPYLSGLDKLPEHRTDDQLNWDRWKERHHNE